MNPLSNWQEPLTPRMRSWLRALLAMLGLAVLAQLAVAQDMRVYTTVSAVETDPARTTVVSHSLTLFHAGKVYDYMEDVGEVVVLESTRNRFIILGANYSATEVPFTEVHQFLTAAQAKSEEYLADIREGGDAEQIQRSRATAFQLNPALKSTFDADRESLLLSGELLSYKVLTATPTSPEFLTQYLDYADWAARLNYVLHPRSAYPTARVQLNAELRQQLRLPVTVELSAKLDQPVRLKARHDYRPLQSIDRQLINKWEQQLESPETRWITFHEYQHKLLTAHTK